MNLMIFETIMRRVFTPTRSNSPVDVLFYATGEGALGQVLIARSVSGVCAILMGSDRAELEADLAARFPQATLVANEAVISDDLAKVIRFLDRPADGLDLSLDMRGTPFQRRVWERVRSIPVGRSATYTEVARWISPFASPRAVGGACAANPIALAIPCHRVLGGNGDLTGYRWGIERKRELIRREAWHERPLSVVSVQPRLMELTMREMIRFAWGISSLGDFMMAMSDKGLVALEFSSDHSATEHALCARFPAADVTNNQQDLSDVLEGVKRAIEEPGFDPATPLDLRGTPYELEVWSMLRAIPVGETTNYGTLAAKLSTRDARDVTEAIAHNPIAVLVPCHRVIKKDGSISGYRWGFRRKRELLARERRETASARQDRCND